MPVSAAAELGPAKVCYSLPSVKREPAARAFPHHSRSRTHTTRDFNCWDQGPFAASDSSEPLFNSPPTHSLSRVLPRPSGSTLGFPKQSLQQEVRQSLLSGTVV